MKLKDDARFSTVCIHAGQEPDPATGAIITPIYQTSTYVQDGLGQPHAGFEYGRTQNPTRMALERNIAAIEAGLPRQQPVREQLEFVVLTHLRLFLIQGTGLCALVLSEGRTKGQDLGEGFVALQRRYTAPLMELLARGQEAGEVRRDIPLRLLRSLVFGPMEHMLWEVVITGRQLDVEASARDLVALLWPALQAPDQELQRLRRLKADLEDMLARAR